MAERRERRPSASGPRPFWSGTVSFGLVNVPVHLYPAVRGSRSSLRMVAPDGTLLSRRYLCSAEDVPVERDEIVRGYEVEKGEFVVVEDDELEALAPESSHDIDLRRFVPRGEVDPARFDRSYLLTPGKGGTKGYRLLARAMAEADRVGIASFVMRDKEYLVAILSRGGLLLAETLRFSAELRSPADVGLPTLLEPDARDRKALKKELRALRAEALDTEAMRDRREHRLLNLVEAKLEADDDVLQAAAEPEPAPERTSAPDLMRELKRSLAEAGDGDGREEELSERSKAELYEQAKRLDISGRGSMSKQELIEAIRR